MKLWKRTISMLLTVCLAAALLPAEALAAESDFVIDSNGVLTKYNGPGGDVVIPDGVTSIGDRAFYWCSNITSVIIPDGVTDIGFEAFRWCDKLTDITLPNSVTIIDAGAFFNCPFTNITIPPSVRSIGREAFWGCTELENITMSNGITTIGQWAFGYCTSLTSITIPSSVTSIVRNPFENCSQLDEILVESENPLFCSVDGVLFNKQKTVLRAFPKGKEQNAYHIPNSVTIIGYSAFETCSNLTSITIPDSVTTIEPSAFMNCSNLAAITIPDSVTSIGYYAFGKCDSLTSIAIPSSVTSLENDAFFLCHGLTDIVVSNNNLFYCSVDGVLFDKQKTTLLQFPTGKKRDTYHIPDSVTSIDGDAFRECSTLTNITFPNSITNIGWGAFMDCRGLTDIHYRGNEAQWKAISIKEGNEPLASATIHYNSPGPDEPQDEPEITLDSSAYYAPPENRLFRVYGMGTSYPAPAGFSINVGNQTFQSGYTTCTSTDDIKTEVPANYTGNIAITKEGYYPNSLPAEWSGSYNYVVMTPVSETGPFAQALLVDQSSLQYRNISNALFGDNISIHTRELKEPAKKLHWYVSIDWNGHGVGTVWLAQGGKTIPLKNEQDNELAIGDTFVAGKTVYLCAKAADGTEMQQKTRILVVEPAKEGLKMDLGSSFDVDMDPKNEVLKILPVGKIKIDLSKLSDDIVPIKFEIKDDGTVTGIIGLGDKSSYSEASYGRVKEAFSKLADPDATIQNIDFAKDLKKLEAAGIRLKDFPHSSFGLKGTVQVLGYFSGQMVNGKPRLTEVKTAVILKGSASYTHNTVVFHIPAYFKVSLAGSIEVAVKMKYDERLDKLTVTDDQPFVGTLSLSAEAGPGREGYLSGGVKGSGTTKVYSSLPFKKANTSFTLSANLSFVGTLLGVSGEWEVCKTPEMVFWDAGQCVWYEKDKEQSYSMRFTPDLRSTPMRFSANRNDDCLATGVNGYMAPSMIELSDGRLLAVWAADIPGRSGMDKTGLYYSVRADDGSWSAPQIVWDDGTNDSLPQLWTDGSSVWLTWQNYTTVFRADDVEDITYDMLSEQMSLAAARFDMDTEMFEVQTVSLGYACQPYVNFENGIEVAWSDGDGVVWTSIYKNGNWSEPRRSNVSWYSTEIKTPEDYVGEPPVTSSNLQVLEAKNCRAILYTSETAENVTNVYGLFHDGHGWGEPLQLTDEIDGSIAGFSAVLTEEKTLHLLANKVHCDAEGRYEDTDLVFYERSLFADLGVTDVDYIHDTLVAGETLTVMVDVTNRSAETVSGLELQMSMGRKTSTTNSNVTILPGQTKTVYCDYALPQNISEELAVEVFPEDVEDAIPSDNYAACAIMLKDISIEKVFAEQTEEGTSITAMIVNRGATDISGYQITYHIDEPDGEIIGSYREDSVLYAAEADYISITLDTKIDVGSMIYADATISTPADENLLGNNSIQAAVEPLKTMDTSIPHIEVINYQYKNGSTEVALFDPANLLSSNTKIFAADYSSDGRLINITVGRLDGKIVSFAHELSAGTVLYFLNSAFVPLCTQVILPA